ncbi:cochlin-like isoform X2 [Hydractinia symbiolongicarpus]|uniref:cochlin-like isoform X2 n=1 Tax=Hydractinia symbiolongicarpus TaxID=13093 RepID=UPI00254D40C6|nr:cochlin-like isoform X2 [Hydractinia symbiolongicarpus]
MKEFVWHVINEFDINEDATHVGVITYSTYPRLEFDFKRLKGSYTKENVRKLINRIKRSRGEIHIDRAIELAKTRLFSEKGGARRNKPQVAIILVDGDKKIKEKLDDIVQNFKNNGVKSFMIKIDYHILDSWASAISKHLCNKANLSHKER